MTSFAENLQTIKKQAKQTPIIAVSKNQPDDKIKDALSTGHRCFGENKLQEAQERWLPYQKQYNNLELHFIGHLQSNKIKDILCLFDFIHTLDREKIAKKIKEIGNQLDKSPTCFIQINTGEEEQKSGILPNELNDFYHYCTQEIGLNIKGLMVIPPIDEEASFHFALLHKLAQIINVPYLSMGMTGDWQAAIKFGATHLRIGSGLFGEKN